MWGVGRRKSCCDQLNSIERGQRAEIGQFGDSERQRVDADADLADLRRLLIDFGFDASRIDTPLWRSPASQPTVAVASMQPICRLESSDQFLAVAQFCRLTIATRVDKGINTNESGPSEVDCGASSARPRQPR